MQTAPPSAHLSQPSGKPPIVLTIAGFDPSNGAGITVDLQVFAANGLFGTAVITALTVQSTRGVEAIYPVEPPILRQTLDFLTQDLPPAGIKIGMLGTKRNVLEVAEFLKLLHEGSGSKTLIPIIIDPITKSSSGAELLDDLGVAALHGALLQHVSWITPNWVELSALAETPVTDEASAHSALNLLGNRHPHLHIIATGGDQSEPVDILRLPDGSFYEFRGSRIETTSTHGTGCAFSSALLSRLVLGDDPQKAVAAAKSFVEAALRDAPGLGAGRGPLGLLGHIADEKGE